MMTQVLEAPSAAVANEPRSVVYLSPENKLIFWTRWLLHIESERVAALVLFLVVMALATAATIVYYNFA